MANDLDDLMSGFLPIMALGIIVTIATINTWPPQHPAEETPTEKIKSVDDLPEAKPESLEMSLAQHLALLKVEYITNIHTGYYYRNDVWEKNATVIHTNLVIGTTNGVELFTITLP